MRTILIIGSGRSASSLIQYLLNKSEEENLHLIIGDLELDSVQGKIKNQFAPDRHAGNRGKHQANEPGASAMPSRKHQLVSSTTSTATARPFIGPVMQLRSRAGRRTDFVTRPAHASTWPKVSRLAALLLVMLMIG